MTVTINGSTGITANGSVFTDASGNVGIGTSSPSQKLEVSNSSTNTTFSTAGNQLLVRNSGSTTNAFARLDFAGSTGNPNASIAAAFENYGTGATSLIFGNINTGTGSLVERARIDSSGNLLVGGATYSGAGLSLASPANSGCFSVWAAGGTGYHYRFGNVSNGIVGSISTTTSATTYATSSDYRLKENIAPMTGALSVVSQLKPCTYTWKATGESTQGFIAHELQAVVPDAVVGEKDAVDADGNPVYQGIDTSFLVATLTAAIQELKAEFDEYKAAHP